MVLKIHGNIHSTCTKRVLTVCEELAVPYEFVSIDFSKGEHKAAAFVAKQPFGQVPYIVDDDGFALFESRAIARYIAAKYRAQGNQIVPAADDIQGNALLEQAISIEGSNFDPFASGIAAEKVFRP